MDPLKNFDSHSGSHQNYLSLKRPAGSPKGNFTKKSRLDSEYLFKHSNSSFNNFIPSINPLKISPLFINAKFSNDKTLLNFSNLPPFSSLMLQQPIENLKNEINQNVKDISLAYKTWGKNFKTPDSTLIDCNVPLFWILADCQQWDDILYYLKSGLVENINCVPCFSNIVFPTPFWMALNDQRFDVATCIIALFDVDCGSMTNDISPFELVIQSGEWKLLEKMLKKYPDQVLAYGHFIFEFSQRNTLFEFITNKNRSFAPRIISKFIIDILYNLNEESDDKLTKDYLQKFLKMDREIIEPILGHFFKTAIDLSDNDEILHEIITNYYAETFVKSIVFLRENASSIEECQHKALNVLISIAKNSRELRVKLQKSTLEANININKFIKIKWDVSKYSSYIDFLAKLLMIFPNCNLHESRIHVLNRWKEIFEILPLFEKCMYSIFHNKDLRKFLYIVAQSYINLNNYDGMKTFVIDIFKNAPIICVHPAYHFFFNYLSIQDIKDLTNNSNIMPRLMVDILRSANSVIYHYQNISQDNLQFLVIANRFNFAKVPHLEPESSLDLFETILKYEKKRNDYPRYIQILTAFHQKKSHIEMTRAFESVFYALDAHKESPARILTSELKDLITLMVLHSHEVFIGIPDASLLEKRDAWIESSNFRNLTK